MRVSRDRRACVISVITVRVCLGTAGVQPHPLDPLLATSGIDYDVKLWAPLAPEPTLDRQSADEVRLQGALCRETVQLGRRLVGGDCGLEPPLVSRALYVFLSVVRSEVSFEDIGTAYGVYSLVK